MKQKIFLILGIIVLSVFGISIFNEFLLNHTYYYQMFDNRINRKILIWMIISTGIPLRYLIKTKKFSLKTFLFWILPLGLLLSSISHTSIKESIFGSQGFLILCFNTLLLYALSGYFIVGILAFGTRINDMFIKLKHNRWQEMLIKFGVGLGVFLLLIYVISMLRIFYPIFSRLLFAGLGFMIRQQKEKLQEYKILIEEIFSEYHIKNTGSNPRIWVGIVLIGFSIMYYFYGFQLSFIPYSTAWDANHAYMYEPKVMAENFGVLWGNIGPVSAALGLWHMFIGFWFSLINGIKSRFWLGPDTIAVAMNFLSGLFVMFFGIGTIKEIIEYFSKKIEETDGKIKNAFQLAFYSGRTLLLLWLNSGMGAFLVFVDNKTDLGVMTMTILAILSGFIFLRYVKDAHHHEDFSHKEPLKYIMLSGFLFCLAIMAKPTSFIDVALFGILLVGLWINEIIALGVGIITIGFMGIMKIANAPDLLNSHDGSMFAIVGFIIAIIGGIMLLIKGNKKEIFWKDKKRYLKYIIIWFLSFVFFLTVFKGPNVIIKLINSNDFNGGNFIKGLLLSKKESSKKILFASTQNLEILNTQNAIDTKTLSDTSSLDSCKAKNFSKEELEKNLRKAVQGNEDVGRYVGYGWKEFTRSAGLNLGYGLLRILYPQDGKCYGLNHDAKLLCKHAQAIESFNIQVLEQIFKDISPKGKVYELLSGALMAYQEKQSNGDVGTGNINPALFRDHIKALKTYYQNHAIKTEYGKIFVPYRYIVPLNVVFNRSLQNLSSYYTDIGFIRLFVFIFIILSLFYGIFYKNTQLCVLSITTLIGRGIWRVIGGGIVWYGIGLILWTILTISFFLKELYQNNKEESTYTLTYILIFLFAGRCIIQIFMNRIRISSQGAGGPFVWYKMNIGKTIEYSDTLQQKEILKQGYSRKDVFDLQFPHYNKFIEITTNRPDKDGVLIAGTYLQYFLKNQHNIRSDGMLSWLREQASDGDLCKTYKRLQENNLKYLVIDPNIGTVVMGEGNESLFHRFFAKKDGVTGKIQEDGAISILTKLWKAGYINLLYSNNLGAKYAFSLDDAIIKSAFGNHLSSDDLILVRSKLAIARFFPEVQQLVGFIANIFLQRIGNGYAIGDIADIYGKIVDENKLLLIAQQFIKGEINPQDMQKSISGLTQDERFILSQYLAIYNIWKSQNQQQIQEIVNNFLGQSLGGSSQLIIFALN